jgi:hypothetical protein
LRCHDEENGITQMNRIIAVLFLLALSTACATRSKPIVNKPIRSIAVIPATNPRWYSFENAAPPVGYPFQFWVNKLDSHSKAKRFNDEVGSQSNRLGAEFTDEVVAALRGYGFTVEVLEGVARPVNDPDNVDYDKISAGADAILHISLSEVGLYSSHMSRNYIPRVNASGRLFMKGQDDTLYDEDICYGVDAKKGKEWAILPDAKFAYSSFDAVMTHIDEIRSSFSLGALAIAQRMSGQIAESAQRPNDALGKRTQ